jgi:NAD(P)-dependent dehydrogenase (short-subunit alcohol dehydrogenase family)
MSFVNDIFGLEGKTVIVAGGAGVIGTVMSGALLSAGANVVIWSRTQASIDQVLKKLTTAKELSARIVGKRVDTAVESEVAEALT